MNCKNFVTKLVLSVLITIALIGLVSQVNGQAGTMVAEPTKFRDWVGRLYSYQPYADSLSLGAAGAGTIITNAATTGPWGALSLYIGASSTVAVDSVVLVQSPTNLSDIDAWCKVAKLEFVNKNSSSPQNALTSTGYFLCNLNGTGVYPVEYYRLIFYKKSTHALGAKVFLRYCGWNQFSR